MGEIPRPEHPRPDRRRDDEWWLNLNGPWQFEIDRAVSGHERGYQQGRDLAGEIVVPFCPESALSGVGDRDFMNAVWYRRFLDVPDAWRGRRVLLYVGACDYETTVWLNGTEVGAHEGGYTLFTAELTAALRGDGRDELVIRALDPTREWAIPRGKQSPRHESFGCLYTRTTGIWQTVWLEAVPPVYVSEVHTRPDVDRSTIAVEVHVAGEGAFGGTVTALAEGQAVARADLRGNGPGCVWVQLELPDPHPWSAADPFLYEVVVELDVSGARDRVRTWTGLRSFRCVGNRFLLNGEPVFLRTVLDQGFYPDGVYTAPSLEALEADIRASQEFGFNGARLHEKLFEPAFLHLCDELGYLVFGEFPDWGADFADARFCQRIVSQWTEAVRRDLNHPSIVGWCPLNETMAAGSAPYGEWTTRRLHGLTRLLDPSRPALDASGYFHFETDIWDCHNYDQDVETFAAAFEPLAGGDCERAFTNTDRQLAYDGRRPYFVSEFGGIAWEAGQTRGDAWGYGERPGSEEEFLERFRGLAEALLGNPGVAGFCYTQLTDVEQEINGLLTFDRKPKFDPARIAAILSQEAAVEE
jgi:beta-galactosidase/beta-glucuronidase